MRLEELLFALEERFWMEGAEYYRRNLADGAVMVLIELGEGAAVLHQRTPLA